MVCITTSVAGFDGIHVCIIGYISYTAEYTSGNESMSIVYIYVQAMAKILGSYI